MPLSATTTYNVGRITPAYPSPHAPREEVRLAPSTVFPKGTLLGEILSAGAVNTTITPAIVASVNAQNVVVASSANILPGKVLTVDTGVNQETVVALAVPDGTHVTAVFMLSHGAGAALVASAPTASTGMFKAYLSGSTDGSQIPKAILEYDCATDANGNITYGGASGGGPFGETFPTVPAYFGGAFKTSQLTGFDANANTVLGGHLISGTNADGVYVF
jgi:hypothetical protein